ncbi:hypothetical protein J7K42_02205 [bacterium]|nr:hypothetical protein [bacterium]
MKDLRDFFEKIDKILKDKKINTDLFVEKFNGQYGKIRDGPELEKFKKDKQQYLIERARLLALASHLNELRNSGYRKDQLTKLAVEVEMQKERFIEWTEDKYRKWKPLWDKLRKEREIEEREIKRKFGLKPEPE